MSVVGIICEYNPFHNGHLHQFQQIRETCGEDTAIVCLMSGNYVQRGAPAIFDKCVRAKAAVLSGSDLVLELPIGYCLSSAEGFAAGGVAILSQICDTLCFGTETMTSEQLFAAATALNSPEFSAALKEELTMGCSFPAARQRALERMISDSAIPVQPNDILGTEYCKAILNQNYRMNVLPIFRAGSYHAENLDQQFPSASAIRKSIYSNASWEKAVPARLSALYQDQSVHSLENAQNAILYRLHTMSDDEFEALPYGSEGLWRRFMHAARSGATLDEIIQNTKTKRYTRTRIDRMLLCAFLGTTETDLTMAPPYVRILAFNNKGRRILREHNDGIILKNVGEKMDNPYWNLENRLSDLYDLFAASPQNPGAERRRRVFYSPEANG